MNEEMLRAILGNMLKEEMILNKTKAVCYQDEFNTIFEKLSVQNSKEMKNLMKARLIELAKELSTEFQEDSFERFVLEEMIREKKFKKTLVLELAIAVDEFHGVSSGKEDIEKLKAEYLNLEVQFGLAKDRISNLQRELNEAREERDSIYFKLRELSAKIDALS